MLADTNQIKNIQYKYLTFIAMFFMTLLLSGTVLGFKIVSFGPFLAPGSTIIYPYSYFIGALVTEVYGYKVTRQLIWYAVICGYVYALLIAGILELPSPEFWEKKAAYEQIFGDLLRFTTGGSIGMVVSEFLNSYLLSKLKIITRGKYFSIRAFLSTSVGELAHVCISAIFIYVGIIPGKKLFMLIITMLSYRLGYGMIVIWPTMLLAMVLKAKEGLDVYDYNTNFTPFRLHL